MYSLLNKVKQVRKRKISYINTYIGNLENGTNEPICRATMKTRT